MPILPGIMGAVVLLWNMYHSISQKAPSPGYHVINVVINLLLSILEIEPENISIKISIEQNYIFYGFRNTFYANCISEHLAKFEDSI